MQDKKSEDEVDKVIDMGVMEYDRFVQETGRKPTHVIMSKHYFDILQNSVYAQHTFSISTLSCPPKSGIMSKIKYFVVGLFRGKHFRPATFFGCKIIVANIVSLAYVTQEEGGVFKLR